jgi:hypothetical protein
MSESGTPLREEIEEAIRKRKRLGDPEASERRKIPAKTLRKAILAIPKEAGGMLWLENCTISDELDLRGHTIEIQVKLTNCGFEQRLRLARARLVSLELLRCEVPAGLIAPQLTVEWDLSLGASQCGPVMLRSAKVGGFLSLVGLEAIGDHHGPASAAAVDLGAIEVGGSAVIDGADIEGELLLADASIRGSLSMTHLQLGTSTSKRDVTSLNADLINVEGPLHADHLEAKREVRICGARIESQMTLEHLVLEGPLNLVGSRIGADLQMDNAMLINPKGDALNADNITIEGSLHGGDDFSAEGQVRLMGAKIGGQATFDGASISGQLILRNAEIDAELGLIGAELVNHGGFALDADQLVTGGGIFAGTGFNATGGLSLRSARIGGPLVIGRATITASEGSKDPVAIYADGIKVAGSLIVQEKSEVRGSVRLVGSEIGEWLSVVNVDIEDGGLIVDGAKVEGDFVLNGTTVIHKGGASLSADRIRVEGTLHASAGFECGEVRLFRAKLGALNMAGADVTGRPVRGTGSRIRRRAINATRIEVAGNFDLSRVVVKGEVALFAGQVGGQVSLIDGTIRHTGGGALVADRLKADHGIFCKRLSASGEVRMRGAKIENRLDLNEVSLEGGDEKTLDLKTAIIDELCLKPKRISGRVDLRHAEIGVLDDATGGSLDCEIDGAVRMEGLSYGALSEPLDAEQRIPWIEGAQADGFYPGVYSELAEAFRRIGQSRDARKVAIAREIRARKQLQPWHPRRLWSFMLSWGVGYGYRNWKALGWLLFFIFLGGLIFSCHEDQFTETLRNAPDLNPWLYAVDAIVPVLDIGQQHAWSASGDMAWVATALAIIGYALFSAVIAAAAGILNRDQQ